MNGVENRKGASAEGLTAWSLAVPLQPFSCSTWFYSLLCLFCDLFQVTTLINLLDFKI